METFKIGDIVIYGVVDISRPHRKYIVEVTGPGKNVGYFSGVVIHSDYEPSTVRETYNSFYCGHYKIWEEYHDPYPDLFNELDKLEGYV